MPENQKDPRLQRNQLGQQQNYETEENQYEYTNDDNRINSEKKESDRNMLTSVMGSRIIIR
jgi:hypothetical protein